MKTLHGYMLHFSSLPVQLVLAVGQRPGTLGPLSGDVGAGFHPSRPWASSLEPALLSVPLRVPGRSLGLRIFLVSTAEELCSENLAHAHQCRCVWGCSGPAWEGAAAAHKGPTQPGKLHVTRASSSAWNKGVRVTFPELEYVQIKQAWSKMQL